MIYPSVKFWHWVLLKDCLWRGNKYSREKQAATRGFRWVRRIVVSLHSDFWTRAYWKTSSQTEKCPQPLIWTSASCDYFFFCLKLQLEAVCPAGTYWARSLWTLTSAGHSLAWCTRWWSSDLTRHLQRNETEVRVRLIRIYPRKHRTNRCAELFED